ncbi:MAG: hypothetical protein SF123_03050, partial [Chloroflexota bacterium]|nr:hypothetical protein [Chloroflexota bacterium]
DWEFTEPVMEPSADGTYWLHFRTPYAVRARLPDQNNVTLALNLRMTGGRVSIRTHYTEGIGYYRFSLSADGLLELARGETVVASVRLVPVQPEHWRSLRLAVTGRSLRASIDGAMVLHYVDPAPLPPGQVWMAVDNIPTGEVWIDNVQMTGSTPRAEIAPPIDMSAVSMNLSPFSTQPVVIFDRLMNATTGDHDLYRMNIDGSGFVALPGNTPGKEYEPVLSPDGKYIAFTAWRDGTTYSNNTNIWVMNSDGSGLWQVTNNAAFDHSPVWSPDGSRLAFVSNRGGVERVYVLYAGASEAEGDQAAMISAGKDPAWSPDGSALVISALNTTTDNTWDLYLVDMTNYNYTRYHLLGESLRAELQPSWSSDNSAIVFTSIIYNGTVPEYTLRRVLRYAPYTVVTISSVKDAIAADYSPNGGELIWRLTSSPTLGGFARAASASPFGVTHYPVHNSSGNDFNPDWGNFAPPAQGATPTPTVTPPMTGVWASDWINLTYRYTNGTYSHPVQPLGNHPATPDTYLIGMAFEWLTMVPSSDHIIEYMYDGGMNFNFRGISVQANGGSFRHRRGVIQWMYRSPQHCGISYAANWMPNYTANAAQICTYYLPGSTASIGGGAILVNGNSRGAFSPESMSWSNWGVNLRGTARVRYIYWKQEVSTPTPTATLPPTLTPTPMPQVYHIPCTVTSNNGYVRVRNFPASDFETMSNSDGQIVMELYRGTTVNVYEFRMARDGVQWARISPYEAYSGNTLWVRTSEPGGSLLLEAGSANCGGSAPTPYLNMNATQMPPVPASFAPVPAGCGPGNICVHQSWNPTNAQDQVNIVAFILACEAGNSRTFEDQADALAVAYVIRNRTRSLTYYGTADQVVRQSDQFDCWTVGAPASSGITNTPPGYGIDATIYDYAVALLNGNLNTQYPGVFNGAVRDLGLYFFGIFVPQGADYASNPATVMAVATQSCNSPRLSTIYIGIAPYRNVSGADNANTYFYDNHGC